MKIIQILIIFSSLVLSLTVNPEKLFKTENNLTYYIEQEYKYTWFEAFLECSLKRMSLLTLETMEKHEDLAKILERYNFNFNAPHLWIGAVGGNRQFSWISNSQPLFTNKWIPGNPDNYNNDERCIHFWENSTNLNDRACEFKYGFICEPTRLISNVADDADVINKNQHKYKSVVINFNNKD